MLENEIQEYISRKPIKNDKGDVKKSTKVAAVEEADKSAKA